MRTFGYKNLTGIDIAPGMVAECKRSTGLSIICGDFQELTQKYDLVYAQAFIHLFPKKNVRQIIDKLLQLSNRRVYFSTTLHEHSKEGMEIKEDFTDTEIHRYRSRYSLDEIITVVGDVLSKRIDTQFRYCLLTDPLGKLWLNGVFEILDIKKQYDAEGLMIYRRLYPPDSINNISDELDKLRTEKPLPQTIMRYQSETVFDRIENFVPYCSPTLRGLFTAERVGAIVTHLLGEKGVLLKDKLNYKMPGCGMFPPHQDAAAGWNKYAATHLNFALGFDASSEENGSLFFCIDKFKCELLSPKGIPLSQEMISSWKWETIATKPGDAFFFDSYLPHFSQPNLSLL